MPQSSVWRILRKHLHVKEYQLQLLQAQNHQDHNLSLHFYVDFQQRLEEHGFAEKLVLSDKAMFHVCGKVNCHNVHIWSTENSLATMEHVRVLPKVNVFFWRFLLQSLQTIFPCGANCCWYQLPGCAATG
jgi:hypothetical protein